MKNLIFLVCLSLFMLGCTAAGLTQNAEVASKGTEENIAKTAYVVGDWTGTLNTPAGKMRLWLTIKNGHDGSYIAHLESIDQTPGSKEEVSNVVFKNGNLSFSIPRFGAGYDGKWSDKGKQWVGYFIQGRKMKLTFAAGQPESSPAIAGLDGHWQADIEGHPLIIRVKTTSMGTVAVLDSPDEGAYNVKIANLSRNLNHISFKVPQAGVTFTGELSEDGATLAGDWLQKGLAKRKINFSKNISNVLSHKLARPQLPTLPLPYKTEDVSFTHSGITLAGTLAYPEGRGPFPAAILISGSGPQDRDETFMEHKPFAVISDHLVRHGVAVLRYDDRGVAKSTGNHSAATSLDFAMDANAAFAFLQAKSFIKTEAIGMIGHSEGGLIAPLAYDSNNAIAFMVLLAGPGVNTVELMLQQQTAMAIVSGQSAESVANLQAVSQQIMLAVSNSASKTDASRKVSSLLSDKNMLLIGADISQREALTEHFTSDWYRFFIKYNPADYLPAIDIPVLALGGSLDVQVPAKTNLAGLKNLLRNNKDATVTELAGLNHMFQHAKTGAISEYRQIEQTFAPEALNTLSAWLNQRF